MTKFCKLFSWSLMGAVLTLCSAAHSQSGNLLNLTMPGANEVIPEALSADGSFVAGHMTVQGKWHIFRWSRSNGMKDLGLINGHGGYVSAISNDGSVIVGTVNTDDGHEVFRWTSGDGMMSLGKMGGTQAYGRSVSGDGNIVVGELTSKVDKKDRIFLWKKTAGVRDMGAPDDICQDTRISQDGLVLAGYCVTNSRHRVYQWSAAAGTTDLGAPGRDTYVDGMSADGSTIIGSYESYLGNKPRNVYRWTQAEGFVDLGAMGGVHAIVRGVSADAAVIVGWSTSTRERGLPTGNGHAFAWCKHSGLIALKPIPGLDSRANGVSADGTTIIGTYTDKHRKERGFVRSVACKAS